MATIKVNRKAEVRSATGIVIARLKPGLNEIPDGLLGHPYIRDLVLDAMTPAERGQIADEAGRRAEAVRAQATTEADALQAEIDRLGGGGAVDKPAVALEGDALEAERQRMAQRAALGTEPQMQGDGVPVHQATTAAPEGSTEALGGQQTAPPAVTLPATVTDQHPEAGAAVDTDETDDSEPDDANNDGVVSDDERSAAEKRKARRAERRGK